MLIPHLEAIQAGLRKGQFPNEASVSQGIVLRVLSALDWPTYDTQVVSPEYALEGRRVDFALSHPAGKPRVFVEVKQVGQSDGAERQLFEYAFHKGVPLVILTDGREWNFFLPAETGDYGERRLYKLDILERSLDESVLRFQRYLGYSAVCSGEALVAARGDYQNVARDRQMRDALPIAWLKLVEEEDEILLDLVADRVESICGYKPDPDTVAAFLKDRASHAKPLAPVGPSASRPLAARSPVPQAAVAEHRPGGIGFTLLGRNVPCRNVRDVLVTAMEALAERDPSFLDRFVSLPRHGRTRRYVARQRVDLYPGRPDLANEHSHRLKSGYWLGINISRHQVERILETASEVAGLGYGRDLVLNLG
jgi:predicted type IV restriction endonuclease